MGFVNKMSDEENKIARVLMTRSGALWNKFGDYETPYMFMLTSDVSDFVLFVFDGEELKEKKVVVYNYYCDLNGDSDWNDEVFWNKESTKNQKISRLAERNFAGTGSKNDPWLNFSVALEKISCILQNTCCQYIRLVLTGAMKYSACAYGDSDLLYYNGCGRLIIDGGIVNVSDSQCSRTGVLYLENTYVCNMTTKVVLDPSSGYDVVGFEYCTGALFNCTSIVDAEEYRNIDYAPASTAIAFHGCGTAIKCRAISKAEYGGMVKGYWICDVCCDCDCDCSISNDDENALSVTGIGYQYCKVCISCKANVSASCSYIAYAYGYLSCDSHKNCSAELDAKGGHYSEEYEFL